jgi:acetolactate synthase-1/2/3 large subunit
MDEDILSGETYKVSDLIIEVLAQKGVGCIFGISGGASLHLLHSVVTNSNVELITMHHEQACAMAADGYARSSGNLGVAIATSGPGATNLLTGIAGCYYDSIPTIFITGQVSLNRQKGETGSRQIGFQETPIIKIVDEVTKYAIQVADPNDVLYELEKCIYIALSGRPGPVLLDVPDDIQRMTVEIRNLKRFQPDRVDVISESNASVTLGELKTLINDSQRPILILGSGINNSGRREIIQNMLNRLELPTLLTWGAFDLMPSDHPWIIGTFGTHGSRIGNIAAHNSDLIISIGSRLDTKATGSPVQDFAPNAKIVMVDVDENELNKFDYFNLEIDLRIKMDFRKESFILLVDTICDSYSKKVEWLDKIYASRIALIEEYSEPNSSVIEPNRFLKLLSSSLSQGSQIFVDTGCAIAWTMNSFKIRDRETRIFHDFNNTAMGWALPALIGGLSKKIKRNSIAIIGDGSLMMSIQELSTLQSLKTDSCIYILNNGGYSMIKQTQDQWFDGDYFASNSGVDLHFPNLQKISQAFGLNYILIDSEDSMEEKILLSQNQKGATLCEVIISPDERVNPQVKFGSKIYDMDPKLGKEELSKHLIF